MFLGIILVCGVNMPQAVEGCVGFPSNKVYKEEEACFTSLTIGASMLMSSAPKGAFISNAMCVFIPQDT